METNLNKWGPLIIDKTEQEKIYGENTTFSQDVWRRFRSNKPALIGVCTIVLLMIFAFIGPIFTHHTYDGQNLDYANMPPRLSLVRYGDNLYYITGNMRVIKVSEDGKLLGAVTKVKEDEAKKEIYLDDEGKEITLSYQKKPATILNDQGKRLKKGVNLWNKENLLGTDALGRDILARLMYGSRISLIVAFVATVVNLVIGILYGGISGYIGGMTDNLMMRVVDIISTIPLTLYVILIMVFLENGFVSIVVALSMVYWVDMARVVRGQIISLKDNEFVLAAKTIGSSNKYILFNHLLPNAMGPILVTATMLIPSAIFMEAFLSFIGLGIAPPMASLGTMCNDALQTLKSSPYQLFLPALVICIIMFAFNYVGDGLRDALDPKLKK